MTATVLPDAQDDLREAARYYRSIPPPAVGKQLARAFLKAFDKAVRTVAKMPLSRPVHPDIPDARFVLIGKYPYLAFYTVQGDDMFVVSVEHATSEYLDRVIRKLARSSSSA